MEDNNLVPETAGIPGDAPETGETTAGTEYVSAEYSKEDALRGIRNSFFPFTRSGKTSLYGSLAFIAALFFFAGPGVISILSFMLPRKTFLNYISSQTRTFFIAAAIAMCIISAWLLIGRIIECVADKKRFLPYDGFGDFLKKNLVRIMLFAVIVFMTISSLACGDVANAFTNQTDGVFTWYLVALGALLVSLIKDKKQMRILIAALAASASLMCFVIFIQYVAYYNKLDLNSISDFIKLWSVDFAAISDKAPIAHVRGVFSNSNHCGYYLAMSALASAGLYITGDKGWKRVLSAIAFSLIIFALVLNDTLGAELAVILIVLLLPVAFLRSETRIWRRFVPTFLMAAVMVLMSLFPKTPIGSATLRNSITEIKDALSKLTSYAPNEVDDNTAAIELPEMPARYARLSYRTASSENGTDSNETNDAVPAGIEDAKDDTRWWLKNQEIGTNRLGLWQYGIHLIGQKPLLGYGVNGTKDFFKNESGLKVSASRVHNEYLQIGIDCGIPAMLMHIASYAAVAVYFFKAMKKRTLTDIQRILFAIFAVYAVSALTGICAYYTASYFYVLLGLLISTFEGSFHEYPQPEESPCLTADVTDTAETEYEEISAPEDKSEAPVTEAE